jgi:hypothetical protein
MLNYLHVKTLYFRRQNRDALCLIKVFEDEIDYCSIMDNFSLRVPTSTALTSVMYQDLALRQGASRLQTSADPWTCSINITSPLRIHFRLLNPTELRHYRVTCIISLLNIKF